MAHLSFRKKILSAHVLIFCFLAIFLYPLTIGIVGYIHRRHLTHQVDMLIQDMQKASSLEDMIQLLQLRKPLLLFRVTLYAPEQGSIFDSHADIQSADRITDYPTLLAEMNETLRLGSSYEVHDSSLFGEQMIYVSKRFFFHEQPLILRAAFPNGQVLTLIRNLTLGYVGLVLVLFLLFIIVVWFLLENLTKPIVDILQIINSHANEEEPWLPMVPVDEDMGEFAQLAETLNTLSSQLRLHIWQVTQEKNEKDAILESLIEGVIAVDNNLVITYMNRMAELFLDVEGVDLIGQSFSVLDYPLCESLLKETQRVRMPTMGLLRMGKKKHRFFDLVATYCPDQGMILVLQDKTSLHRVIEMGQDFVANASHELKTPITVIRGFAETLHDHPDLSPEVSKEVTTKIVRHCTRMEILIKNLLALASVDEELPDSRLEPCHLDRLLYSAKASILEVSPQAHVDIELVGQAPFVARVDSDLLFQAIFNLLDNAVKYSTPPAKIMLRLIHGEGAIVLHIVDQGIGIPKEELPRIFERFFAVDKSHSRSLGGSGLGLSIVHRIIEKHHGSIEVSSELGKGTTFVITLPLR